MRLVAIVIVMTLILSGVSVIGVEQVRLRLAAVGSVSGGNPIPISRLPDVSTLAPNPTWAAAGATIDSSRTLCYQDTGGLDSLATVNSQIAGCATGTYVLLQAGSYSFAGSIVMKSGITLRGAGPNSTFITITTTTGCTWQAAVCFGGSSNYFGGGEQNIVTWSSGYTKGTSILVFAAKTNISVGTVLHLDELSDTCNSVSDDLYPEAWRSTQSPNCSYGPGTGEANGGGTRTGRAHAQEVMVTAVEGGSCAPNCDVTITPPLFSTFVSGKTPQAVYPTTTGNSVGIEDLSIDVSGLTPDKMFDTSNTSNSWIKHVRSIDPGRSNVVLQFTVFFTIRDSYFFRTANHSTTSYGLESLGGCNNLIENNILQWISSPVVFNGACGNVVGYNYAVNDEWTDNTSVMFQGGWSHNGGSEFNLYEGNDWPGINFDIQHGTQMLLTVFRNHLWGRERSATLNTQAYNARAQNRFMNVMGNVMGVTGYHTQYQCNPSTCANEDVSIYTIGIGYDGIDGPVNDSRSLESLFRWGNWDVVTSTADSTNGDQTGTRWCGNSSSTGWTTRCGSASEVPTGIGGSYSVSVPTTETLPTSLYLSAKPTFFKSADPWPLIGPDVSGGSLSGVGGHVNPNPARQCYLNVMGGTLTGTTVLAFTCNYPLP